MLPNPQLAKELDNELTHPPYLLNSNSCLRCLLRLLLSLQDIIEESFLNDSIHVFVNVVSYVIETCLQERMNRVELPLSMKFFIGFVLLDELTNVQFRVDLLKFLIA